MGDNLLFTISESQVWAKNVSIKRIWTVSEIMGANVIFLAEKSVAAFILQQDGAREK